MRKTIATLAVIGLTAAASIGAMSVSGAASGTGVYATWTESGTTGAGSFSGTYFPAFTTSRTNGSWQIPSGASAWLSDATPFGAEYGSSRDKGYLGVTQPLGGQATITTITFATAPTAGTWGFALGDADAENITITATDANGAALNVSSWYRASFNYCAVSPKPSSCPAGTHTDQPVWNSPVLTGSGSDTYGAAAWFKPTGAVKTITFTQERNVSGAPVYQLWIAADVLSSPSPSPSASASPSASPSASISASASASASPSATSSAGSAVNCTTNVTNLVNGSFEEPVIPAKSYRQIKDSLVPGWSTTASDRLIEIWSDGFQGVDAPYGSQFAEINATTSAELYQDVATVPGQELTWTLYHRARGNKPIGDTMSVNIGAPDAAPNSTTTFTDALTEGWVLHTGTYVVPAGQTTTRFGFESGPTASGSKSVGNFLDSIYFTQTECLPAQATAEPSPEPEPEPTKKPTTEETPGTSPTDEPTPQVVTPDDAPVPDDVVRPTKDDPIIVNPDGPTVIDVIKEAGADPDSEVTAVEQPKNGTADIRNDKVIYTPDEGFRGKDDVVAYVTEPDDTVLKVALKVDTGRVQKPIKPLGLPSKLGRTTTTLIDHAVVTNARQTARVQVTCTAVTRSIVLGDMPTCNISRSGSAVSVQVVDEFPVRVKVVVSAPAKGRYGPYRAVREYLVRP